MKQKLFSVLSVLTVVGAVIAMLICLPTETVKTVVEKAAVLSVGLQQPKESVELLRGWVQKPPAALGGVLREQRILLGDVTVQVLPQQTTDAEIPEKQPGAGVVLTQQMSVGKTFVQGVAIKNNTGKTVDIAAAIARKAVDGFDPRSNAVQVLITHTHTTECYLEYDAGFFNPDAQSRTDDPARNMVAVGEKVAEQLRAAGIGVIHDTTIHDQPYSEAYTHSRKSVQQYLEDYPTIRVVLDIHRDAIYQSDGTRVKPTAVINGKSAAQMMVIVGMKNTQNVPNSHTADNLAFGAHLQQVLHTRYAGLMRPMVLADARYNQQLCKGMVLVEVGSDVNTLTEALYSGELLGQGLVQLLKESSS